VEEMVETELQYYINLEEIFEDINWRPQIPKKLFKAVDTIILKGIKKLVF
jgi:hypothetical protein